jgi:DNA-binding CsgD family transcriptional regulator
MTDVIDTIRPMDLDQGLTIREQEILQSISAGFSNKQIANLLSISPYTVKNHVHNILVKLNIRRRGYVLGRAYYDQASA